MSPLSLPVLGGALLVSFPALWNALVAGTTPTFVGLFRFLVAILVCWFAFAVLSALVGPPPPGEKEQPADGDDPAGATAAASDGDRAALKDEAVR